MLPQEGAWLALDAVLNRKTGRATSLASHARRVTRRSRQEQVPHPEQGRLGSRGSLFILPLVRPAAVRAAGAQAVVEGLQACHHSSAHRGEQAPLPVGIVPSKGGGQSGN